MKIEDAKKLMCPMNGKKCVGDRCMKWVQATRSVVGGIFPHTKIDTCPIEGEGHCTL